MKKLVLFLILFCGLFSFSLQAEVEELSVNWESCTFFSDKDKDGVEDSVDNCPKTYNPDQDDSDRDGIGDVCDDDDCGCESERQLIYVCQDNMTRRIRCSALSDAITHCGPCESRRMDPCMMTCAPDEDGKLVFCRIPSNPQNFYTVKGDCDQLDQFFNADGSFMNANDQCGPCDCAMIGDVDSDGDGVCDGKDECPNNPDKSEAGMCGCDINDSDGDWVCDPDDICPGWNDKRDDDNDGVPNGCDACPGSDDRADMDGDGIPDGCDSCMMGDADNDGVCDNIDVCMGFDDRIDTDNDGIPDGCDPCAVGDSDNDGVCDDIDICIGSDDNADMDGDGIPDGCDSCMMGDADGDGVCDNIDVCMGFDDRVDTDADGIPDGCDSCPNDPNNDSDNDGVCDDVDVCIGSDDNADMDGDGIPDGCDSCMMGDSDNDGVCDNVDICMGHDDNVDSDGDGIPDGCDDCSAGDVDNDGICDDVDTCTEGRNDMDIDGDGVPDACDVCPMDFFDDFDGDGICDFNDLCQGSDDNLDVDNDGIPDGCDRCPNDPLNDSDRDGVCDSEDLCIGGDDRIDNNNNGIPDACDNSYCEVIGNSQHEWIENVKLNDIFTESGDNGGYADFTNISLSASRGEDIEVWLTSGYTDNICALSHYAFADWNGDGDFDDDNEFLFLEQYLRETGATVTIPNNAVLGSIRLRLAIVYGRLNDPCDPCFNGEVEDYTLIIGENRTEPNDPNNSDDTNEDDSTGSTGTVEVVPNPVQIGTDLRINVTGETASSAEINIYNFDGNLVMNAPVTNGTNILSTNNFLAGIYVVEYIAGGESQQIQIVMQD